MTKSAYFYNKKGHFTLSALQLSVYQTGNEFYHTISYDYMTNLNKRISAARSVENRLIQRNRYHVKSYFECQI